MAKIKTIYLAGGCFWGVQKFLSQLVGVVTTETGYANGLFEGVTYKQVCSGETEHAEVVKVEYDSEVIPLESLLQAFFEIIDPTSLNKQGHDVGTQYRVGVYVPKEDFVELKPRIEAEFTQLQQGYSKPLVIEYLPLNNYTTAEDYHQDYLVKNPTGYCHINFLEADQVIAKVNQALTQKS